MRVIVMFAVIGMLAAACSGAEPEPITVEGYLTEWCNSAREDRLETWSEFVTRGENWIVEGRDLLPPDELRAYHFAWVRAVSLLISDAATKPPGALASMEALSLNAALQAIREIQGALEDTPAELQERLAEAGCWLAEDS